jgi:hypothetical protein
MSSEIGTAVFIGGGTYLRLGMLTYEGSWGQGGPGEHP